MKNYKRFVALVLCALMLVGIAPIALDLNTDVVAVEASSEIDAVVQGENDVVFVFDKVSSGAVYGNYISEAMVNAATALNPDFDRIILVLAVDFTFTKNTGIVQFFKDNVLSSHNFVITQKCQINYPEYVQGLQMTAARNFSAYEKEQYNKGFILNYFAGDTKKVWTFSDSGSTFGLGCSVTIDYVNIEFQVDNPFFYCYGFNLTVGENAVFTYGSTSQLKRPIVMNGAYASDSFYADSADANVKNRQTITLLSGEYQYVVPRFRTANTTQKTSGKSIKIILGDGVKVVKTINSSDPNYSAVLAYENFENCNVEYEIGKVEFSSPFYVLGNLQVTEGKANKNSVKDCNIKVTIDGATFRNGIAAIAPVSSISAQYPTVQNLKVDFIVKGIRIAEGETLAIEDSSKNYDITSTITYAPYVDTSAFTGYDTKAEATANVCSDSHRVFYAIDNGTPIGYCTNCHEVISVNMKEGYPVVYVNVNGDAFNGGLSADTPVAQIYQAFDILSTWNKGGYIQLTGNVNEQLAHTISSQYGTKWVNCGDLVIIDGAYGNATSARLTCSSGQIHIFNDIEMRNITLAAVSNHKAITLNYYDFKAVDNCTMAKDSSYNYSLMLGSTNGFGTVPDNATDRVVDQTVEIDGFKFLFISAGSKSFAQSKTEFQFSREYSIRCSGTSNVYIGANSHVDTINARVNYYDDQGVHKTAYTTPDTVFHINKAAVDLDNIKFLANTTNGADSRPYANGKFTDVGFNIYCDDVTNMSRMLNIVDDSAMSLKTLGRKTEKVAVRAGFKDVDGFLNGDNVAEFGVLFATKANAANIAYVATVGGAVNGVAKSLCYDKANDVNEYLYDGIGDVGFYGAVYFEDENGTDLAAEYGDLELVAAPYAVINVAKDANATNSVAATYTVIGATTDAFSYNGLAK